MAENQGVQEARQLSRVAERRVAKERAAQRLGNWTVQSEMRGALGRTSAGA